MLINNFLSGITFFDSFLNSEILLCHWPFFYFLLGVKEICSTQWKCSKGKIVVVPAKNNKITSESYYNTNCQNQKTIQNGKTFHLHRPFKTNKKQFFFFWLRMKHTYFIHHRRLNQPKQDGIQKTVDLNSSETIEVKRFSNLSQSVMLLIAQKSLISIHAIFFWTSHL